MSFAKSVLSTKEPLVISQRQGKWLEENPNPKYSKPALDFAADVLSGKVGGSRGRSTGFRASSLGYCKRRQVYKASGVKGIEHIEAKLANIFATGNFLHLKWQMMGLTEGWLAQAEIPAESPEYNFGGTLDGIVYDGSLFEFKTINHRGFTSVCEYGPRKDHIKQAHGYMWLKDLKAVSFVYEDKSDQEWREFRVLRDESLIDEIKSEIESMNEMVKSESLPDPLSKCLEKTGMTFRQCPYRKVCVK